MGRIMKILGIITIVVLLLGGGAVVPVAATPEVTVSIDAPDEADAGSNFTANVNITEVVDFDACTCDVSFDASVLRLDDVTSGLIDSTTIPVSILNEISTGTWRVVLNVGGYAGVSGSGYLAVLHFHVVGAEQSTISLSNGVLSDNTASEIEATWGGNSVMVAAAASEDTTPPPVVNSSPEATTSPAIVNPPPEATAPNEAAAPLPTKPINWPVLWGVIGGVIMVGLMIFLLARRKAY